MSDARLETPPRVAYRPDRFLSMSGSPLVGKCTDSRKRRRQIADEQVCGVYRGEDTEKQNKRVRTYLTDTFRDDPLAFFKPFDHERLVFASRAHWLFDDDHIMAFVFNIQFKIFRRNGNGGKVYARSYRRGSSRSTDVYERQLQRCQKPSEEEILSTAKKNITFWTEYVNDTSRRLRQLGGRQFNKASTHIDCVVEIYNSRTGVPLSADMRNELMRAKRTKIPGTSTTADRQLLGVVSHVLNSILRGEQRFFLVVYDTLLGRIGKSCAPRTHAFLRDCIGRFENKYVQLKRS